MNVKRIGHQLTANKDFIYCIGGKTNDEGFFFNLKIEFIKNKFSK
jgi:hypothetical protein